MLFEEILPRLRKGEKAKLKDDSTREAWFYGTWIACYMKLPYLSNDAIPLSKNNESIISLACLNDKGNPIIAHNSHSMPLWAIMSDKWEIVK